MATWNGRNSPYPRSYSSSSSSSSTYTFGSECSSPKENRKPCKFYRAGHCPNGFGCNFSHDKPVKKNRSQKVCKFFRDGNCRMDTSCKFSHPVGQLSSTTTTSSTRVCVDLCDDFTRIRVQRRQQTHTQQRTSLPALGRAMSPPRLEYKTRPCKFFKAGYCRNGSNCNFCHDC